MQTQIPAQQTQQNQSRAEQKSPQSAQPQFEDVRPEATAQLRLQSLMANSAQSTQVKSMQAMMAASTPVKNLAQSLSATNPISVQRMEGEEPLQAKTDEPVQREQAETPPPKPNSTGLPDNLKAGIENLSGISMDHVKVHYNSDKPAQLQAHAYAQGSEIHVASGQEQHLPHEAWHVVQQAQGRVNPTMQMKGNVQVNDNKGLENEADVMGAMAVNHGRNLSPVTVQLKVDAQYQTTAIVQGAWILEPLDLDSEEDESEVWKETDATYIYDPDTEEFHWGDEDEFETPEDAERAHIPYKISLLKRMSGEDRQEYFEAHPEDIELQTIDADIQAGSLEKTPLIEKDAESGDLVLNIEAIKSVAPAKPGEAGSYRLYGAKVGNGWQILHLKLNDDNQLTNDEESATYHVLNRPYGKDLPFVSEDSDKTAAKPTQELIEFLKTYGYTDSGGKAQDRIHHAIVKALRSGKRGELSVLLANSENARWYTNNIRQGSLNELILTSQSYEAVVRGEDDAFDPHGQRNGEPYTFVELQRDTSFPTKDFVFKNTFDIDGALFQNSHVNGRMYRTDGLGKKHKTVGPMSPQYHLAVGEDSLRSLFDRSHSMKALVARLIELHKGYLATKADILSVPASQRGKQVYEMRGGYPLKLDDANELNIFASIVENHTRSVMNGLKQLFSELEDVDDRPPPSPYNMPSPQYTGDIPDSPSGLDMV